ncbi:MAG: hypothetical protein HZC54_00765 [Verrucomicrobia bacterium]|nr:hypothetical protein [Verrucomicrobiota bacterium]
MAYTRRITSTLLTGIASAIALDMPELKVEPAKARPREPIPDDPWEFITRCGYTFDELAAPGVQPLRRYPKKAYLKRLVRQWQKHPQIRVKKSRQILVTWLFAALYVHAVLVRPGTRVAWFCLDRVRASKHIRSRAFRIYENIPDYFDKPLARMADGVLSVYHDGEGTLPTAWIVPMAAEQRKQGDAADKMRSETWTHGYLDEAEFYPTASELIHSLLPSCANLAVVSSPNGDTFVNRLGYSTDIENPIAPLDKPKKTRLMKGMEVWDRYGFHHIEVHYSADPDKNPETKAGKAWYARERQRYPDSKKWRREMELDSTVAAGLPVYADTELIVRAPQAYRPTLPLFCGRDFGFANPYAVFFQVEPIEVDGEVESFAVRILLEVRMCNLTIEAFDRNYVSVQQAKYFPGAKAIEYGDPAGEQRKDTSAMSAIAVLKARGRTVFHRSSKVDARLAKLQAIISLGWLHADPTMAGGLLGDLAGGYYRDAHGEPVKDDVHDHGPDAFGYAIDCIFDFDDPEARGVPVYHPGGLDDVRTGLQSEGNVWRPTVADERRRR